MQGEGTRREREKREFLLLLRLAPSRTLVRALASLSLHPSPPSLSFSTNRETSPQLAVTDPLVLRGMLALRPANVAVLGGRAPRLGAARERARAEWAKAPDGRGGGGAAGGGTSGGRGGAGGPTLYGKARAAAWPGAAAEAEAGAAAPAAAAAAAAAAPPARAPLVAAPPPQQQQQQQQEQNQAPSAAAAAPPPAVILLDSSDDEDVKMEARDEGGEQQQQQPFSPLPAAAGPEPASLPLPAAAGPAPASLPRRPLSEAAAAAATAPAEGSGRRCLVRGRVVQATSALRFMDAGTGSALEEFGLDVELEESSAAAASGGSGSGEEEGFTALARVPATLSHPLISGLLGCISPRDLVDQYAREGGREALVRRLGAVKAFFDAFDGWLAVEGAAPAAAKRESGGGSTAPAATASLSLVVVGWWEA